MRLRRPDRRDLRGRAVDPLARQLGKGQRQIAGQTRGVAGRSRVGTAFRAGRCHELLQPLDDKSIWAKFIAEKGEGIHHFAFGVSNYDELVEKMQDYNHYACIGVLGEILPDARNYVSIHPTEKDQYGLPVARRGYRWVVVNDDAYLVSGRTGAISRIVNLAE